MDIEDSRLLLATAPNYFYKNYHRGGDLVMLLYILTIKPRYNALYGTATKKRKELHSVGLFTLKIKYYFIFYFYLLNYIITYYYI